MRSRGVFSPLRWLAFFFLLAALVLTVFQLVRYSRLRANLPTGLQIAGIPVGGLDRQQAAQRLLEAYTIPVELQYGDALIQLDPSVVDFQLDLDTMLAAADIQRTQNTFWEGFWDFLWGRTSTTVDVPLRASFSETRLRTHLEQEVAQRYDQPPSPAQPIVGTVSFQPGTPGSSLDIDGSIVLIENALFSNLHRQVALPLLRDAPPRPAFQNLEVLIRQTIDLAEFDGLVGIYLMDLQTNQELHMAYSQGEMISVQPDIAYTASSMIKIPIMVSVFNRLDRKSVV